MDELWPHPPPGRPPIFKKNFLQIVYVDSLHLQVETVLFICFLFCMSLFPFLVYYTGWSILFLYGCESWTIKKAECWRIDAFELWCWRRLLRVPWTARRFNQSNPKEIGPEYSLEELMLKLKLQYFGHLTQITDSLEKTLMLGEIEGRRRRGWQRMRWLECITDQMNVNLSKLQGIMACCSPWVCKESDMTEWLNWTELNWIRVERVQTFAFHLILEEKYSVFYHWVWCGIFVDASFQVKEVSLYSKFSGSFYHKR